MSGFGFIMRRFKVMIRKRGGKFCESWMKFLKFYFLSSKMKY